MRTAALLFALALPLAAVLLGGQASSPGSNAAADGKEAAPRGLPKRVPWTTSRLTGSPDPPPLYRMERVFPKLTFKSPLLLTSAPGTDRLFVGEQAGLLFSIPKDQSCAQADLFLDLTKLTSWDRNGKVKGIEAVYGLTFHPRFVKNRYCYVSYVLAGRNGEALPEGTRVSRFRVSETDPPRIDPKSEKILITWLAGGHNGGCLCFGPDGFLYISTGDATSPNPPDGLDTGQGVDDLLSCILRIDVDREEGGKAYAVPADNPFVKTPGAKTEVWAYGFRNPWKMSFDRATGELWAGDVGWELWELVYRIQKGGNYGWSVKEGRQWVKPEGKRGPTPILPPAIDFPHTEAASITGGYVYRGQRLKDLVGAYVCGDWVTGKVWGTRFQGEQIASHREIASGPIRVVAFAEDHDGELYILHYDEKAGTIHQFVRNDVNPTSHLQFPRKLSETGLFASTPAHKPAPGVVPFSVNAEQWTDHATSERLVALPGTSGVRVHDSPQNIPGTFFSSRYFFPKDGVLARTFSLEMERGNPRSRRRLETQVLHYDGAAWRGYSYQWNDEQTDAVLVPAGGLDQTLVVTDAQAPGGKRKQTWHYPSRTECLTCHNPWGGQNLSFTLPQLDRPREYGGAVAPQVAALQHMGLLTPADKPATQLATTRLTNPHDEAAGLNERARSYLHANCAHCHQLGAGGTADFHIPFDVALDQTKTVEVRPVQGTFEIPGSHILSPGDPYRSVLFYRMSKLGRGRMPHIGSEIVDERGLRLIHDWIRQLPPRKEETALLEKLRPANGTSAQKERADAINRLLSSTGSALRLATALGDGRIPEPARSEVVAAAMARSEVQIRDLFERFVPDEQRVPRLGNIVKPEALLALKGDAVRGKELFFKNAVVQCANCHRLNGTGTALGPDLTQIAKKYTRAQILESILEPSKSVDPLYVTHLVETKEGQVYTGLLVSRTAQEVVLKDVKAQEVRIPAAKIEALAPQQKSIMPDLLLRDLTAAQVADLLEYLASLK